MHTSTTKPHSQTPLDAFGGRGSLPRHAAQDAAPRLACELCGDRDAIVFSSDLATVCQACATSLARLPRDQIPRALVALRFARSRYAAKTTRRCCP